MRKPFTTLRGQPLFSKSSYVMTASLVFQTNVNMSCQSVWLLLTENLCFFDRPAQVKWQLMIASCYRRSGNYQQALETYKKIHKRFPDNIECKCRLGTWEKKYHSCIFKWFLMTSYCIFVHLSIFASQEYLICTAAGVLRIRNPWLIKMPFILWILINDW